MNRVKLSITFGRSKTNEFRRVVVAQFTALADMATNNRLRQLIIHWQTYLKRTSLRLLIIVATIACCVLLAHVNGAVKASSASSIVYTGVAAGDATETSAILWTRTAQASDLQGIVQPLILEIATDRTFKQIDRTFKSSTQSERDHTLKLEAKGLASGTHYYYRFRTPGGALSQIGKFTTAPKPQAVISVKFGFSGDADGKWRPYPLAQALSVAWCAKPSGNPTSAHPQNLYD